MLASHAPEAVEHVTYIVDSILPAVALFLPFFGGIAVILAAKLGEKARNSVAILFAAETFIAVLAMAPQVSGNGEILLTRLPLFFGDINLAVDQVGIIFALFASFIWLAATVYSWNYIQHEEKRTRYHCFSLFTEAAALGIFMAADFFVLFIFFELMGIIAYMLVVHTETEESLKAGTKYMALTILGGLSLLMGIFLLIYYGGGGFSFTPEANSSFLTTGICFVVAGFLMGGFGVKAGMVPLHIWLPLAHPAAPSPASALLSGVMIKAGAFGFIRLIGTFLSQVPVETAVLVASHGEEPVHAVSPWTGNLHNLGIVIIILALGTMVTGMALAVFQDNMKRLLAYSSISQMGFILMGVGTAAYLGAEGALGLEGALEHAINHAFFKSLLFLCAGAVYYKTHTLNMRDLGGLWRKMPWTTTFAVIGGMGIMGISFFNGFVSKTILHHSITECCAVGGAWLHAVDWIFIITAGGTICYISKFLYFTFFKKPADAEVKTESDAPIPMLVSMGALAGGVLFLGLFPGVVLNRLMVPALHMFPGLDATAVHHAEEISIFTGSNLFGIVYPVVIGIGAFLVFTKWDLYRYKLPAKYGIDNIYTQTALWLLKAREYSTVLYSKFKAWSIPRCKDSWDHTFSMYLRMRDGYHKGVKNLTAIILSLPRIIKELPAYAQAHALNLDIAFGVMVIAFAIAALALTLL